jgi:hypothetical protein
MFYGNAVSWKGMEKSGKRVRIFPHLTTILGKVEKRVRLIHITTKPLAFDH